MNETSYKQFLSAAKGSGKATSGALRILSEITKEQAESFATLCSLITLCYIESPDGKVNYWDKCAILPIYDNIIFTYKIGLDFETIRELETLGLIGTSMFGFLKDIDTEKHTIVHFDYCGTVLSVTDYNSNAFPTGNVLLTREGKYLSDYIEVHCSDEYVNVLKKYFYDKDLRFYEKPLLSIRCDGGNLRYERINRDDIDELTENV